MSSYFNTSEFTTALPTSQEQASLSFSMPKTFTSERKKITLASGQTFLAIGTKNHHICRVLSGALKVAIPSPITKGRHKDTLITDKILGPGEIHGFEDYLFKRASTVQVIAAAVTEVEMISYDEIDQQKNPKLLQELLVQAAKDLENQRHNKSFQYLSSIRQKIAHKLLELSEKFGETNEGEILIQLKLSRSEIAQLAGTINESLSRHLSDFENENILRLEGRLIFIKDQARLREVAGCNELDS